MTRHKHLFLTLLIAGTCITGGVIWLSDGAHSEDIKKPTQGPVPVHVATAAMKDVPVYLNGIGNVLAMQNVTIRTQIDGQLMSVHFKEGQTVRKGAPLAEIDARAVQAALAKSKADKANNTAQLQTAQLDLTRYQNLLKDDAIAKQKVDQQKALVDQLEAAAQVSQAEIDMAQVQLSYAHITSPINGRVGIRNIDPGNIVKTSDANGLVTITQVDPIAVIFSLPQQNLHELQPLLTEDHEITIDILPKEGGHTIASGHLLTVDNQIDETTGTVRLKAIIPNEKFTLWPGQFVIARIALKTLQGHPVLPLTALQQRQDKNFVYRITGDTVEAVDVDVLYQDDEIVVIGKGIKENDQIVTDGQTRLKPGSTIQIIQEKSDDASDAKTAS